MSSRVNTLQGAGDASRQTANINAVLEPVARAVNATPIMGAPQPPWTPVALLNGYAAFTPSAKPSYLVDCLGAVITSGLAINAAGVAGLTPIFTLPVDLRPLQTRYLGAFGSGGNSAVVVDPSGSVSFFAAVGAGGIVSLDGLRFLPGV